MEASIKDNKEVYKAQPGDIVQYKGDIKSELILLLLDYHGSSNSWDAVVLLSEGEDYSQGYVSHGFAMKYFKKFEGSITLSN